MAENTVEKTTEQVEPVKTEPVQDQPAQDSDEVKKLKTLLSKANSEAAEFKRQLRDKQSEAERAEADRAEADKKLRDELNALRREKTVGDYTNRCLALNFDAQLAATTASALADGDVTKLFDCLKTFVDNTTTRLANEALNRQPGLSTGTPPSTNTVDAETAQIRRWMGI